MPTPPIPAKRKRGRPLSLPPDTKERYVPLTNAEFDALRVIASGRKLATSQLIREAAIALLPAKTRKAVK